MTTDHRADVLLFQAAVETERRFRDIENRVEALELAANAIGDAVSALENAVGLIQQAMDRAEGYRRGSRK